MKAPSVCAYCRRRIEGREGFVFLVGKPVVSPDAVQLKRLIDGGRMVEKVSALSVAACERCGEGWRPMRLSDAAMGGWAVATDSVEHLNAGKNELTVSMAERLIEAYPGLDILYSWQSSAHLRAGRIKSAIASVERGVEQALRKRYVLHALAEASFQQRDLRAAVYGWSQCILCQRGTHEDYNPFLYLSYVARYLGARRAEEAANILLAKSDALRVGAIRPLHRQYKYITKLSSDDAIRAYVDQLPSSRLFAE